MASLLELLGQQLDPAAVKTLSQQLGLDSQQTQTAVAAAVPTLIEALARQADQPEGGARLHQALSRDHDGSLLDNLQAHFQRSAQGDASGSTERMLGHILGDKRSRVEQGVGRISGLDASQVAKLLGALAPLVLGALGKQQRSQGFNPGQLTDWLKQERVGMGQGDPSQATFFSRMLDQDGDGDFDVSDIMRLGTSLLGRMFR